MQSRSTCLGGILRGSIVQSHKEIAVRNTSKTILFTRACPVILIMLEPVFDLRHAATSLPALGFSLLVGLLLFQLLLRGGRGQATKAPLFDRIDGRKFRVQPLASAQSCGNMAIKSTRRHHSWSPANSVPPRSFPHPNLTSSKGCRTRP
jgi:hypothetical protein